MYVHMQVAHGHLSVSNDIHDTRSDCCEIVAVLCLSHSIFPKCQRQQGILAATVLLKEVVVSFLLAFPGHFINAAYYHSDTFT